MPYKPRLRPQRSTSGKQLLGGQYLFPMVYNCDPQREPNLTGMILELPDDELVALIKNDSLEALEQRVEEAQQVLNASTSGGVLESTATVDLPKKIEQEELPICP